MRTGLKMLGMAVVAASVGGSAWAQAAVTYEADPAHASLGFRVRHLVISKVSGGFSQYTATLQMEGAKLVAAEAVIQAESISTANKDRDDHLRTPDFLDVAKYPTITFKSTEVKEDKLVGDLTIHGVTKRVELDYELNGPVTDPWGNQKIGIEIAGDIKRSEFGLTWNKALETGGMVVGDEVEIAIDMEFAQKK